MGGETEPYTNTVKYFLALKTFNNRNSSSAVVKLEMIVGNKASIAAVSQLEIVRLLQMCCQH